jgi:endonuclease YncB( thermonuclease family)
LLAPVCLIGIQVTDDASPGQADPLAREAVEFTRQFLKRGEVLLRFDRRKLDDDDHVRAYVSVQRELLNEELVRRGLAKAQHQRGDSASIARRIRQAEEEARAANRGRWAENAGP